MMVMTAKVNIKKVLIALAAVAALILALILLLGGGDSSEPTAASTVSDNDSRIQFLESFGWQVAKSPTESSQVRIPEKQSEVFDRYNALQKSQGYDLSQYAGQTAMRYVYKIENYPGATEPVYATVLVYKDQIIGGDVTNTASRGAVSGFKMPTGTEPTVPATQPSESTAPSATTE